MKARIHSEPSGSDKFGSFQWRVQYKEWWHLCWTTYDIYLSEQRAVEAARALKRRTFIYVD